MLAVKSSLALTVFVIGIESTPSDTMYLLRRRALFARSIISMNVIMPLLALWLATTFGLLQPVKIALVALAISPVPPLLPFKAAKAGGNGSYTIGLLVAASVLSIVLVPATAWMFGVFFAERSHTVDARHLQSAYCTARSGSRVQTNDDHCRDRPHREHDSNSHNGVAGLPLIDRQRDARRDRRCDRRRPRRRSRARRAGP
jgi:hypothetical protein